MVISGESSVSADCWKTTSSSSSSFSSSSPGWYVSDVGSRHLFLEDFPEEEDGLPGSGATGKPKSAGVAVLAVPVAPVKGFSPERTLVVVLVSYAHKFLKICVTGCLV